jgi:uncharacterized protein YdeI (YjbR/CyaY-like superfamily)
MRGFTIRAFSLAHEDDDQPSLRHANREGLCAGPRLLAQMAQGQSRQVRRYLARLRQEALCFGWIDSTLRPLDEKQYMQLFTPRKPKSSWSKLNKTRVAKLVDAGLMQAAGAAVIAEAKRNGSWTKIDAVESLTVPSDLQKALESRKGALENFNAFPRSVRKGYLHWIDNCKRPETRAERIQTAVQCAFHNVRFRQDLPPSKR